MYVPPNSFVVSAVAISSGNGCQAQRTFTRYFPVSMTIADADVEFKEWANSIVKMIDALPYEERIESISIEYGSMRWTY